jgi:hypothetical protein
MGIVTLETGLSVTYSFARESSYRIITLLILVTMMGAIGLTYANASPSLALVDATVPQIVKINGP